MPPSLPPPLQRKVRADQQVPKLERHQLIQRQTWHPTAPFILPAQTLWVNAQSLQNVSYINATWPDTNLNGSATI